VAKKGRRPVRLQCAKCPWKTSTDPYDIPNGYCEGKHAALESTIAEPGSFATRDGTLRMMACHESEPGAEEFCVGWFGNQMGRGGNLGLRLACAHSQIDYHVQTVGEQHDCLEDTLPGGE